MRRPQRHSEDLTPVRNIRFRSEPVTERSIGHQQSLISEEVVSQMTRWAQRHMNKWQKSELNYIS